MSGPILKAFDHAGKYVVGYVNAHECLDHVRNERNNLLRALKELTMFPSCKCDNYYDDEECMNCIRVREAKKLITDLTQPTKE